MNNISPLISKTLERIKKQREKDKENERLLFQEQLAEVSNANSIPDIFKD
jgi:hypothetical protein